ncbi:MAG: radical SAM protein [Blautia sp.]|nr:radical SAM protein [Blautia sp.]
MKKSKYNYIVKKDETHPALLFNTKTYALVELEDDIYDAYKNEILSQEQCKQLSDFGFFVPDNVDEIEQIEMDWINRFDSIEELTLTTMVTDACNFRCPYCYQPHITAQMTEAEIEKLCKCIHKYGKQNKKINLRWFGGEPLLNTNPIFKVEEAIKKENIQGYSNITTNGYLLTDELLERLLKETRIRTLQITLDGTEEQHNSTRKLISGKPTYKRICANIKKAIEKEFFVIIRINLNKNNQFIEPFLDGIEKMNIERGKYVIHVNNAHEFDTSEKINGFYFDTAYEYGNAYDKVQNSFIKYGYKFPRNYTKKCGCAFEMPNTFLVDCDLKLYFCTSSEKDDFFCQGYINDEGEICTNENYLKRRNLSVFHDDECKNCIFLPMCMGGCNYCRMKSEKYCIPEKYFFDDFVKKLYCEAKQE